MALMAVLGCVICFLLLLPVCGTRTKFRFAMAINGPTTDFGFTFHQNIGRIDLQKYLTAKYPNMVTEHTFGEVTPTYSPECDPQFEAWAQAGYAVIFGVIGHQWCFARLAPSYPNVSFVGLAGSTAGPPNYANLWVRFYQVTYLAGYLAGLVTKSKKVCVLAGLRVPAPVMDAAAFCRGVRNADPTVQVHLMETGVVADALLENWIVNQSYAIGCDVIFVGSTYVDGLIRAKALGMLSVGMFTDARLTVGETVLTSAFVNFSPLLIRAAEAALNGTFATETSKPDWWMGWEWGGMILADPSFNVPADVSAKVQAQTATLSRVYCGRVCTRAGCLCNSSSCCLTDAQLSSMLTYPDFVIEHGVVQVPGRACRAGQLAAWHLDTFSFQCSDCPAGTIAYNVDEISECRPCPASTYSHPGSTVCLACPAGTYNDQQGQGQCLRCPIGTIAANPGSSKCNMCPSGLTNGDATQCAPVSLVWLAGVGGGVAAAFLLIGLWSWRATKKMREMRKQFSNNHVAAECAAAIARLDLQAVAWLADIPRPNCIQLSFIRIVQILNEVRKYVPDQLLESLASGNEDEVSEEHMDQGKADSEEEDTNTQTPITTVPPSTSQMAFGATAAPLQDTQPSHLVADANVDPLVAAMRRSRVSLASSRSHAAGQPCLWAVKKVTYLLVRFNVGQLHSSPSQLEGNMNAFLGFVVETARAHSGTLGAVGFDRAIVHWGTGKRAVAEAPAKAVEAALALTRFTGKLRGGATLRLTAVVGCSSTLVGVVETASNSFFMVGGGSVPAVERIASTDWNAALGAQVLITSSVQESVRYSYVCHPRLVDEAEVVWEPISRTKETVDDEWMYQLQEYQLEGSISPALLLPPFKAACKGNHSLARSLAQDLLAAHRPNLRPADLAALELLSNSLP